jgi:hypothetical protein
MLQRYYFFASCKTIASDFQDSSSATEYSTPYESATKAANSDGVSQPQHRPAYWLSVVPNSQQNKAAKNGIWPQCHHIAPNPDRDKLLSTHRNALKHKVLNRHHQKMISATMSPSPDLLAKDEFR